MTLNPIGPGVSNQIAKTIKQQQNEELLKGGPHFEQAFADQNTQAKNKGSVDFQFPPEKK